MLSDYNTEQPWTKEELDAKRATFWDTAPKYDGREEIWLALKAVCEAEDDVLAQAILDSANITVPTGMLHQGSYDELGNRYVIPPYCFMVPKNLISTFNGPEDKGSSSRNHAQRSHNFNALDDTPSPISPTVPTAPLLGSKPSDDSITVLLRLSTGKDIRVEDVEKTCTIDGIRGKLKQLEPSAQKVKSCRFMSMGRPLDDAMRLSDVMNLVQSVAHADTDRLVILQVMLVGGAG